MTLAQRGLVVIFAVVALLLNGCTNRLVPPEDAESAVTVYLMDHGRHPSLVMPRESGDDWVRYTHGEWRWYAEGDVGVLRGAGALLWPTKAAIGRGELRSSPDGARASADVPEGWAEVYALRVSEEKVEALKSDLESYFEDREPTHNPTFNLDFVPYPGRYWIPSNSNRKMVQWLRALDIEVRGLGLFSNWNLEED